jgi:tRNA/rRNA methyltransferase
MSSHPLAPSIVLVEPQEEGNIGATARAMANMGLDDLVLVRPQARIGRVAHAFAVGARPVLESASIVSSLAEALNPFQHVVGTTSARAREQSSPLLTPKQLPTELGRLSPQTSVAVVFGPEVSGLDNEQLARCGVLVRVPCAPTQPTLNLSQAVLILAYELYMARIDLSQTAENGSEPATAGELDGLFDQMAPVLDAIGFRRDDTFGGVLRDLRRLAARSGATPREVGILRGICRRAMRTLERRAPDSTTEQG